MVLILTDLNMHDTHVTFMCHIPFVFLCVCVCTRYAAVRVIIHGFYAVCIRMFVRFCAQSVIKSILRPHRSAMRAFYFRARKCAYLFVTAASASE